MVIGECILCWQNSTSTNKNCNKWKPNIYLHKVSIFNHQKHLISSIDRQSMISKITGNTKKINIKKTNVKTI